MIGQGEREVEMSQTEEERGTEMKWTGTEEGGKGDHVLTVETATHEGTDGTIETDAIIEGLAPDLARHPHDGVEAGPTIRRDLQHPLYLK